MTRKIAKIVLIILAIAGACIGAFILYVVITIALVFHDHNTQLKNLQKETKSLVTELDSSNYTTKEVDCHDVELQNQCYVTIQSSLDDSTAIKNIQNKFGGSSNDDLDGDSAFTRQSKHYSDKKLFVQYGLHQGQINLITYYQ